MLTKAGFFIFVGVVPGMLLAVAIFDLATTWLKIPPVGHYVQEYLLDHQWVAGVVAFVFGAMIAHFFLHIPNG